MKILNCANCDKPTNEYSNYCDFDCHIESAKKLGGKIFTPNGLPVKCIKANSDMFEHEHGDHEDYMFPIDVVYTGAKEDVTDRYDGIVYVYDREVHAVLYCNSSVILTIYECNYYMWSLSTGRRSSMIDEPWVVSEESREKVFASLHHRKCKHV